MQENRRTIMRIKYLIALLTAFLLLPVTGCDLETAGSDLHGKWIAYGGISLEFTTGRFIKTLSGGVVQRGTYTTDGSNISFYTTGQTTETLPYTLTFPELVVGAVTYYHDSPAIPHNLTGFWHGFRGEHSTQHWYSLKLSPAKPSRDDQWVYEGAFEFHFLYRGEYKLNRRNFPDAGSMLMISKQIHGRHLKYSIGYAMPPYLLQYFDWEALNTPEHTDEWWYTYDDASKFYLDAAQRVGGDLFLERQILAYMNRDLDGIADIETYSYTVKQYNEILFDFYGNEIDLERDDKNRPIPTTVLTVRTGDGQVATFTSRTNTGGFAGNQFLTGTAADYYIKDIDCDCVSPAWAHACYHDTLGVLK